MHEIHPVTLLDFCNALNGENPHAVFGVSSWPLEPNTLGVFKRTGPYTSEWQELYQSEDPQTLYKAARYALRRCIHDFSMDCRNHAHSSIDGRCEL